MTADTIPCLTCTRLTPASKPGKNAGSELAGTDAVGAAFQGGSVALSADGSTASVGGPSDNPAPNGAMGAAWVYTRSGGIWTQQQAGRQRSA